MNRLKIHPAPLTRTEICETHGEFTARCMIADIWSKCPTCSEESDRAEREKAEAAKRDAAIRRWQAAIGESGIPERFHDRTLESFHAATDAQKYALVFARGYAENFALVRETGRSAMFIGKPGTGKTHLAAGIGLSVMRQNRTVLFTTVMRAVRRVKDSWSKDSRETESQAVSALVFPDLLILDEVGVQFGSEFERNIMFDVLNERYEKRRPTLLLSNLAREDVTAYLGERIIDRLREDGGKIIPFTWDSHRGR